MGWFKNLKTRAKLFLGFGVMCALLIGLAVLAYNTLAALQKNEREGVDQSHRMARDAVEIRAHQNYIRGTMLELLISDDTARKSALRRGIEERSRTVDLGVNRLKAFVTSQNLPKELALVTELEKELTAYREGRAEELRLIEAGKPGEARALGSGVQDQRFERARTVLSTLDDGLQNYTYVAEAGPVRLSAEAVRVFVVVTIAAVLFALFMIWLMNHLLAAPLQALTGVAERVAAGDLTVRLDADERCDEIGVLQQTIKRMVANLHELNRELRQGVGVLASSSAEMLAAVSQVAASATETAAAVSETSTTAEEVKQTAHLSNQKAKAVQETAQKAAAVSQRGGKAVSDTLEGMNRIQEQMESIAESVVRLSEQGQTIGEIIATVNDLAEQSNVLAVNAAIEATRAGEYGKGFAVVAQEVKSLAEQSRQATTQVRTILMEVQKATSAAVMATEQGTKAVAAGVKQATDAGESIRVLSGSVDEASQAATQITASSQQQLVGMDQIAAAIANIRQATTQNVAGTKQVEASAHSLQELGGRLKTLVERQRVEG